MPTHICPFIYRTYSIVESDYISFEVLMSDACTLLSHNNDTMLFLNIHFFFFCTVYIISLQLQSILLFLWPKHNFSFVPKDLSRKIMKNNYSHSFILRIVFPLISSRCIVLYCELDEWKRFTGCSTCLAIVNWILKRVT